MIAAVTVATTLGAPTTAFATAGTVNNSEQTATTRKSVTPTAVQKAQQDVNEAKAAITDVERMHDHAQGVLGDKEQALDSASSR